VSPERTDLTFACEIGIALCGLQGTLVQLDLSFDVCYCTRPKAVKTGKRVWRGLEVDRSGKVGRNLQLGPSVGHQMALVSYVRVAINELSDV
jgi:hypothetical protein